VRLPATVLASSTRRDGSRLPQPRPDRRGPLATALLLTLACAFAASSAGCRDRPAGDADAVAGASPARAFYFWRTRLDLSTAERDALTSLRIGRLFVRFFDVEWSAAEAAPRPLAIVDLAEPRAIPAGVAVVPVVFVRADVFGKLAAGELPALADRTWRLTRHLAEDGGFTLRELQVDCDWTATTRTAYFAFLDHLGKLARPAGVTLSATIRLHQVKYRERTGVPPVERGMLMFYNMGRLSADAETASIFDPTGASRYLARVREYPLPLDAALPLWSWTVHLRGGEVVGLLQSTDPAELESIPWLRRLAPGRFVAIPTAFLHGEVVREDDILKAERTGADETRAAAEMVAVALGPTAPRAASPTRTVALFDLSERNLARHGQTSLERLFPLFR
jgi:hypothetical protein